jgi:hypothetical protein
MQQNGGKKINPNQPTKLIVPHEQRTSVQLFKWKQQLARKQTKNRIANSMNVKLNT